VNNYFINMVCTNGKISYFVLNLHDALFRKQFQTLKDAKKEAKKLNKAV